MVGGRLVRGDRRRVELVVAGLDMRPVSLVRSGLGSSVEIVVADVAGSHRSCGRAASAVWKRGCSHATESTLPSRSNVVLGVVRL